MPFCTNCGKENAQGTRFCSNCGTEQNLAKINCRSCGKTIEPNEKFCSGCGTPLQPEQPKAKPAEDPALTAEGRKIISSGPKQKNPVNQPTPPPSPPMQKKKKRGGRGCFITMLIILAILFAGAILVINFATDWFDEIKEEWNKTTQVESSSSQPKSDIPAENQNQEFSQPEQTTPASVTVTENKDVKGAAKNLETIFENSDIRALQSMLTETSAAQYNEVLEKIQPHMPGYAKAFKNRKLVYSTPVFAQYAFSDNEGNEYTVEFALDGDGLWKLVRF